MTPTSWDPLADPFAKQWVLATINPTLAAFNRAEVLTAADVHVARQLGRLGGEANPDVLLAVALTVRAVRNGSVCLDVSTVRDAVVGDAVVGDTVSVDQGEGADTAEMRRLAAVHALPWPEPQQWAADCRASVLVRDSSVASSAPDAASGELGRGFPLHWHDGLLYLDRYWRQERIVAAALDARQGDHLPDGADVDRWSAAITRMFAEQEKERRQRIATALCAGRRLAVIAGGPGTGKTTAVARMLAVLVDAPGPKPRIALAAPTGKAAARLQQAVRDEVASFAPADAARLGDLTAATLHRLLGWKPKSKSRFKHDAANRLPYDIVVVDETSMVSLTMMARLMEALAPDARLVLVGDPDQLASVEAGAVLGDIVARATDGGVDTKGGAPDVPESVATLCPADGAAVDATALAEMRAGVTRLTHRFRFDGGIAALADAVRLGDADQALRVLGNDDPAVSLVPWEADRDHPELAPFRDQVVQSARTLMQAALTGDAAAALAAMDAHRLLCAHRNGPFGAARWASIVQRWIAEDLQEDPLPGNDNEPTWWMPGRPLLINENDYELGLFNGDTGVVIRHPARGIVAVFGDPRSPIVVRPSRLSGVHSVYAMTIHKSQGSQFEAVSVILPPAESVLLTRELLYTAATRASGTVRIIGSEEAVRAAVTRPVTRASGLRRRSS